MKLKLIPIEVASSHNRRSIDRDHPMMSINSAQLRAARAMLGWSMTALANSARVSISTIKRAEDGVSGNVSDRSLALVLDALMTEGVRFLDDDGTGPGVRLKRR